MRNTAGGLLSLLLGAALALTSCDAPTGASRDSGDHGKPVSDLRALPADFSNRPAVAYSGYRGSTNGGTNYNVVDDISLIKAAGFRLIRTFGANNPMIQDLVKEIHNNQWGMTVQLGVWISGSKADADPANQAEIQAAVSLASTYPDVVAALSVGNETMVTWTGLGTPVPAADLAAYIHQVRAQVAQPVTTDDNWAVFADPEGKYPDTIKVLSEVDYVAIHTYPLADSYNLSGKDDDPASWDYLQLGVKDLTKRAAAMMDAALGKAQTDYGRVKDHLASQGFSALPIVIGETGWKSTLGAGIVSDRAHPVNQKMYFDRLNSWTTNRPAAIVYFEAFDEPWKGADDGWGLFDVDRKAKYVLATNTKIDAGHKEPVIYTDADAVYCDPKPLVGDLLALFVENPPTDQGTVARPDAGTSDWNTWDDHGATSVGADGTDNPKEGSHYVKITPKPKSWGWGSFIWLKNGGFDLSNFKNGTLHFSVRTTYPGQLLFGFHTALGDALVACGSGHYGYRNDGSWSDVSIPISVLTAGRAVDWLHVDSGLTVADKLTDTGNASAPATAIDIDNVYWTKN